MALSLSWGCGPVRAGLAAIVGLALLLGISGSAASARAADGEVVANCDLDIIVAVDVSMSTQRQQDERRRELSDAIGAFVDLLSPRIRFALVRFGTDSKVMVPLRALDPEQRRALQQGADALTYRDQWTDIRLGLDTAFQVGNRSAGETRSSSSSPTAT
jgi:hypothetical protein